MIRLMLRLFKINDYESCKSCDTLRQQLTYANQEKKELLETILSLTRPVVHIPTEEVRSLENFNQAKGTFARRRAALEENERRKVQITKNSPFIAKPSESILKEPVQHITSQSVDELERELGIDEKTNAG